MRLSWVVVWFVALLLGEFCLLCVKAGVVGSFMGFFIDVVGYTSVEVNPV